MRVHRQPSADAASHGTSEQREVVSRRGESIFRNDTPLKTMYRITPPETFVCDDGSPAKLFLG